MAKADAAPAAHPLVDPPKLALGASTRPRVLGPTGRSALPLIELEQCFCGRFRQRFLGVVLRPRRVAELRANCTVVEAVSVLHSTPMASTTVATIITPTMALPWRENLIAAEHREPRPRPPS